MTSRSKAMPSTHTELEAALKAVRKVHGEASTFRLTDGAIHSEVTEVIPTGIDALDHYGLQCGGLPVGRVSELFSAEGKGKTSFGLAALASCQRNGGVGVLIETEHATEASRIEALGVDKGQLVVFEPESLEQGLGQIGTFMEALPKSFGNILFVWDSLAATLVEEDLKLGPDGKSTRPGAMAAVMSARLKRLLPTLAGRAHLQFINQTREKIGVLMGSPEYTPGGNALRFLASVRIRIGAGVKVADVAQGGKDAVGHEAKLVVKKNRHGFPNREVHTRLIYKEGWDNDWTTLRLAKSLGLVTKGARDFKKAKEALEEVGWDPVKAQAKLKREEVKSK